MQIKNWEPVIGLEIHAQLATKRKLFSPSSTSFGAGDNENTDPVCTGMPGTLPVLNEKAVEYAVKIGLALNCKINTTSVFARKNYFYPDLPKGYQISQYEDPICLKGSIEFTVENEVRKVGITRAHLEEDAGKSTHHGEYSLINLNRSSVPLLEIVSEPDIRSAKEAAEYARAVRAILLYLGVSDGNLEEGSMRCDCNVSIRPRGQATLGTRTELKNINSFRFIEKAIEYEIERQIDLLESGGKVVQETRLYDSAKNKTFTMRSKEEAQDYRYFPDPDLLPLMLAPDYIENLRQQLPELPQQVKERFKSQYSISDYDAQFLSQDKALAHFYEDVVKTCKNGKAAANWIMVEYVREMNNAKLEIAQSPIKAAQLGDLINLIENKAISGKIGKQVFVQMFATRKSAQEIIQAQGLTQISDEGAIEKLVEEVLANNPKQVQDYKNGQTKIYAFFVGQIMKATKGQASPETVNKILLEKLKN